MPQNHTLACDDWTEWTNIPHAHHPFHYWLSAARSEEYLAQRTYISACLLWTALHDNRLARMMADSNPNWSAVCAYYSMIHALRLFWFTAYGSYPTGHAEMVMSLTSGGRGAKANWASNELSSSSAPITVKAFQGWLADCLSQVTLADRLPRIGKVLSAAKLLRNDSNYESLILAHQYWHGVSPDDDGCYYDPVRFPYGTVNVRLEFEFVTSVMLDASREVLSFVTDAIRAAYSAGWPHILHSSLPEHLVSSNAHKVLLYYVKDKISRFEAAQSSRNVQDWFCGLPVLADEIGRLDEMEVKPIMPLTEFVDFGVFGLKSNLMREFAKKSRRVHESYIELSAERK